MSLEDKLRYLKIKLNSIYKGGQSLDLSKLSTVYEEVSIIEEKLNKIRSRKFKIKKYTK